MKTNNKQISKNKGMTLLELTVVILVLLTLISVLFIGAKAWKDGADRSNCILNIRNFQVAVRSYGNMNSVADSETIAWDDLVGAGKFVSTAPECPTTGLASTYTQNGTAITYVVATGAPFLTCGTAGHAPDDTSGW